MKFRTTLILLLLVVAGLCVLIFHTAHQYSDRQYREQQMRVFPKRELLGDSFDTGDAFQDDVRRITIESAKERIVLVRDANTSAHTWRIEEPFAALADPVQVSTVIKAIESMQATVVLTDEPGSPLDPETYGLTKPSRKVAFHTEKSSWTLQVGQTTADAQSAYVARPGSTEPRIYVVPLEHVGPFFLKGSQLRDDAAIRFNEPAVRRMAVLRASAPALECQKGDTAWMITQPVSDMADSGAITRLLNGLASLRIAPENFVSVVHTKTLELGLDTPSLTLIVADDTGERSLTFGASVPGRDDMVFARRSADGAVFTLPRDAIPALAIGLQDMRSKVVLRVIPDAITHMSVAGKETFRLDLTNGNWVMDPHAGQATDSFLVRAFLEDLARSAVAGWIDAPGEEQLKETGLHKPRILLKLEAGGNGSEQTLFVGSPTGDGDLYHARRGNFGPVLLIDDRIVSILEKGPLAFLLKAAFEFNRSSATAIHIRQVDTEIGLEKRESGWTLARPAHGSLDEARVNEILWALCYIEAKSLLPADGTGDSEFGLSDPRFTVTVSLSGEPPETKILEIGRNCGDRSCYARVRGAGNVFTMSESVPATLTKNMNKLLNDAEVDAK